MEPSPPAAGWYTDPWQPGLRYWDGTRWTGHVAPNPQDRPGRLLKTRDVRISLGAVAAVLTVLGVLALLNGWSQGFQPGSFALVSYGVGVVLLAVAGVLGWLAVT